MGRGSWWYDGEIDLGFSREAAQAEDVRSDPGPEHNIGVGGADDSHLVAAGRSEPLDDLGQVGPGADQRLFPQVQLVIIRPLCSNLFDGRLAPGRRNLRRKRGIALMAV